MVIRREILKHFEKIRSIIMILAQDRRIRSNELDDLNQTLRRLTEQVDALINATESMEMEASGIIELKNDHTATKYKMGVCLELCGVSKVGIKYLMSFPTCFLELALVLRLRKGRALETERDFLWLTSLWQGFRLHIENDMESFQQANFLKQIYSQTRDPVLKNQTIQVMKTYVEDLAYLKSKLGKEIEEKELLNLITNHWYEAYRHYTTRPNN